MTREPIRIAVGLGSNLGDRPGILAAAVEELDAHAELDVLTVSPWLENRAVGGPADQPDYLNGVAVAETTLEPDELLAFLQSIETRHGRNREREGPSGARTLDLDLLLYGDRRLESTHLKVPHPRMLERDFVMVPLASVAPSLRLPQTGRFVRDEVHRLAERELLGADVPRP